MSLGVGAQTQSNKTEELCVTHPPCFALGLQFRPRNWPQPVLETFAEEQGCDFIGSIERENAEVRPPPGLAGDPAWVKEWDVNVEVCKRAQMGEFGIPICAALVTYPELRFALHGMRKTSPHRPHEGYEQFPEGLPDSYKSGKGTSIPYWGNLTNWELAKVIDFEILRNKTEFFDYDSSTQKYRRLDKEGVREEVFSGPPAGWAVNDLPTQ